MSNFSKFCPQNCKIGWNYTRKTYIQNFPDFPVEKKGRFALKKNTASNLKPPQTRKNDSLYLVPTQTLECVIAFLVFLCLLLFVGYSGASGPTPCCCRISILFHWKCFPFRKAQAEFWQYIWRACYKVESILCIRGIWTNKMLTSAGRQVVPYSQ